MGKGTVKTSAVNEKGETPTSAFWFAGAGAAEVEVERETGMVRVVRYATSADVGKALHPLACEQQLRGAAVMGIGQTLMEEMVYQEGLLINPNFLDYNLPRFLDVPEEFIPILVERPHPEGPLWGQRCRRKWNHPDSNSHSQCHRRCCRCAYQKTCRLLLKKFSEPCKKRLQGNLKQLSHRPPSAFCRPPRQR